jgi:predicted Zn-dependent peptidase
MYHDNPRMHSMDEIQKLLYNGTMRMNLAGTFETMNSITRDKILEKFKKVYTANNLILCVVGDCDFNSLIKFAETTFENEKGKISYEKFGLENGSRVEERTGIDQASVIFAYHVPVANEKNSYAALVLNSLMADGMSSRLFGEIREKRNLAYAVKGESNINKTFAYNLIYVGTMKDNVEKVKKLILDEFEDVSNSLGQEEVEQIKEQLIGNYQISMEDSQQQMVNLLAYELQGNAKDFYDFEKKIIDVKLSDVKKLAFEAKNKYSFFALIPR